MLPRWVAAAVAVVVDACAPACGGSSAREEGKPIVAEARVDRTVVSSSSLTSAAAAAAAGGEDKLICCISLGYTFHRLWLLASSWMLSTAAAAGGGGEKMR